jgi:hypothetical protein
LQSRLRTVLVSIEQLKSQVNKEDNAKLKKQITEINNIVSDYQNLAAANPLWSKVIKAFVLLPPPDVQINTFNVDASKTVTINGYSPTRESVIQLYNNILADSKNFYGVDYPFENVARATKVNFHFTFKAQDALLKN